MPEDAMQYFPASKKKLAVIHSKSGTIALWDLSRHAAIRDLDKGHFISQAVFSPDESLVATVTTEENRWENPRLRLWKTDSGELLAELRPFEQTICEKISHLFWSPDGEYVLAATKAHGFFTSQGISVWNAKTGRHRGEFTGCSGDMNGIILLSEGRELASGDWDGTIRFWDFKSAMNRIQEFEKSLISLP
jgi:dipeptidyl aminopeptidase/acylaminoacyl peptidase